VSHAGVPASGSEVAASREPPSPPPDGLDSVGPESAEPGPPRIVPPQDARARKTKIEKILFIPSLVPAASRERKRAYSDSALFVSRHAEAPPCSLRPCAFAGPFAEGNLPEAGASGNGSVVAHATSSRSGSFSRRVALSILREPPTRVFAASSAAFSFDAVETARVSMYLRVRRSPDSVHRAQGK
jgi:hypothetical protein